MRAYVQALAACAVLISAAPAQAASLGTAGSSARAWPRGEAAVGYRNEAALQHALAGSAATIVRRIPALHVAEVRPSGSVAGFAANVARLRGIVFVQRLAERAQTAEPALALPDGRGVPWEWQYAITRSDAVPAEVLQHASSVTIAVIDSGADISAPDLAAKSPLTYNARTGTSDVRDTLGHGTFVAALAGGSTTNGDGIAGFGGDAKLMIVKAGATDGSFTDVDEANGIVYAVDHGARVLNLSLGGPSTSTTERRAIEYAVTHGALVVAAAGNEYQQGNPIEYPAALVQPIGSKGVGGLGLAVGASTMTGSRALFSNTGSYISLVAPGENVFSAVSVESSPFHFPRVELPGSTAGLYGYASGTSFAAPEVAGAAALVWAANPLLNALGVAQVLKESASGQGAWTPELGYGVLDVGAAVAHAKDATQTSVALLTLNGSVAKRTATLTATLRSSAPAVTAGSRVVTVERFDGKRWARTAGGPTSRSGQVTVRLRLHKGVSRLRARWGGSADLAGAVSRTLALRVR
jgi:subtilisin family serine protease